MKSFKKLIYILALGLAFAGCGNSNEAGKDQAAIEESHKEYASKPEDATSEDKEAVGEGKEAQNSETRVITDHAGREVELPAKIERVVIDQVPILSTYMAYHGGSAPYIAGYAKSLKDTVDKTVLKDIAPELMEAGETVVGQSDLNVEEIIKLNPDVIFYNAKNQDRYEELSKSGIPAVGFATIGDLGPADPIDRNNQWLKLLEEVFGEEGKTDDFIRAGEKIVSDVEERINKVPEEKREDGMILWKYAQGTPIVAGKGTFGDFWLKRLKVANVFEDVKGYGQVNVEEIYKNNPAILYIDGPGLLDIKRSEVYDNTVEGIDFSVLDAVKNERVYNSKLGMWNWLTPNSDAPLVYAWLASVTYPEAFEDYDLEGVIKEYYKKWYDYDLTDQELEDMFDI